MKRRQHNAPIERRQVHIADEFLFQSSRVLCSPAIQSDSAQAHCRRSGWGVPSTDGRGWANPIMRD
jgi:hypothetical protein